MDEFNLMDFNSPVVETKAPDPLITDIPNVSPGNNPFDSLSKYVEVLSNMEIKKAIDFHTSSTLNEDVFKLTADINSYGRESLACLWDNDMSGRESLGILKLEAMNFSFNNDNLSVPKVCTSQLSSVDEQKSNEFSSSPLNTAFLHPFSYCQRKQSILTSGSSMSSNPSLFFNSGSLDATEPSKIYSPNNTRNYDWATKLEDELNNAFLKNTTSKLKFSDSSISNSCFDFVENVDVNLNKIRQHMFSLPELKTAEMNLNEQCDDANKSMFRYERPCQSESEIDLPSRKVLTESLIDDVEDNEVFNDSVFIEANHIASKIADGSILLGQSFEDNLLDSTSPPSFNELEENEPDDAKPDAEAIFKVIDKMLPIQTNSVIPPLNEKDQNDTLSSINNNNNDVHVSEVEHGRVSSLCQNLNISSADTAELKENYNISNNKSKNHSGKHSISQASSSSSAKSRDANELLHDLSEIINHEIDSKQKMEGQQLLCSLANILCSNGSNIFTNKCDTLEDSGHSSIEHDDQQNDQDLHVCYEVLDLRVAASKSNDNEIALDLSMTSKVESNKRLSQSFSFSRPKFPAVKIFNALKTQTSIKSSNSSLDSNNDKLDELNKLKPKKIKEKASAAKKGPLKAVIPLGDMSRRFSKVQSGTVTPPKVEQTSSTLFKVKRTSTPITEPQIKPVAQSTPDGSKSNLDRSRPISCSSQLKKRKFYCPVSPLARPSSIGDNSTNTDINKSSLSGSAPNLSNRSGNVKRDSRRESCIPSPQPMYRRHSATELKVSENNSSKLKRSYSIGKDPKTASIINKMKENVRSSLSKGSNTSLCKVVPANKRNIILQEKNAGVASNSKSSSLLSRFKKSSAGKENISN